MAGFFAMVAGMLTRFAMYGGMFGGGRDREGGGLPVWVIVMVVSPVTYSFATLLIRAISRATASTRPTAACAHNRRAGST